ncbi:MAG: UDP-3-O-(3-hydroxymyristoyl)glucosamine N-acyltransferase, partial [Pseudomonadota bacterium]
MGYTIAEIAEAAGLEAAGDLTLKVDRPAEPVSAAAGDLALAMSEDYAGALAACPARAAIVWPGADWQAMGLDAALMAPRARVALAGIGDLFAPPLDLAPGIHPSAIIDPSAELGADVWIGPLTVIGAGAQIGDGARILGQVTVGAGAQIGPNALLHPGTRIGARVVIGKGFIAQANAVIGADGFSYVTPEKGAVESAKETGAVAEDARNIALRRIASLGTVEIGDDVEVGAGATIDRGTVAST